MNYHETHISRADLPETIKAQLIKERETGEYALHYNLEWISPDDLKYTKDKTGLTFNEGNGWTRPTTDEILETKTSSAEHNYMSVVYHTPCVRPDSYYTEKINAIKTHNKNISAKVAEVHARPYDQQSKLKSRHEIEEYDRMRIPYTEEQKYDKILQTNRTFIPKKIIRKTFSYSEQNSDDILAILQKQTGYETLVQKIIDFKTYTTEYNSTHKSKRRTAHGEIIITPEKTEITIDWRISRYNKEDGGYFSHIQKQV